MGDVLNPDDDLLPDNFEITRSAIVYSDTAFSADTITRMPQAMFKEGQKLTLTGINVLANLLKLQANDSAKAVYLPSYLVRHRIPDSKPSPALMKDPGFQNIGTLRRLKTLINQ